MADVAAAGDHEVHEAVGPPLSGVQAGSAIALGVLALLVAGVLPVLLAALKDEHRLSEAGIGLSAMTEALAMGAATGLAGAVLKPERLKLIGVLAAVGMAAADLATLAAHGGGVILVRGLAGLPEGLLLWICIAMIARTVTPERWAGVLFTAMTLAQFVVASISAAFVVPRFHANGGFVFIALISLAGAPIAILVPSRYAPLAEAGGRSFPLPGRGWIALAATLILAAATGAVGIYLVPLAEQAGLGFGIGGTANALSLAFQVIGGALATALAGRIRYFAVFLGGVIGYFAAWTVYGFAAPAWLFLGATAVFGFIGVFVSPFFVPLAVEADPSRRTAVQSGAAQLFGGALGPLLASLTVSDASARGVLVLGAGLAATGLSLVAYLHFSAKKALA